jgi:hypothetical protein
MSDSGKINGETWLDRRAGAWLSRLSVERFDAAIRPLIPAEAAKKSGRRVLLDGRAVIDAIVAHRAQTGTTSEDPLMAGGDSPALERYRAARASLAELELERQRKTHISLSDIETMLNRFASLIRRAGETLQRRFGNDSSDILNTAIDDAEAVLTDHSNDSRTIQN